jgi:signal transduction histidine kinase
VGTLADSLDDARRTLTGVGEVATEMHRTIDALFALARYESGQEPLQVEPLDLGALVHRQLAQLQVAIAARGVHLQSRLATERWVLADAALLARLVANLLGNAVSHSPREATVVVELDGGELRVENESPHLATADVARLRERFFRATSDSTDTHAGLGLAIAAVSGLRLRFELRDGGRLSATVGGFRELDGRTASNATGDAATVGDDRTSAALA